MANEEVATLLGNEQPRARAPRGSQTLRVIVGVVSAIALVAGSIAAVELVADAQTQSLSSTPVTALNSLPAPEMEAQFGWGTINNGWCSVRAVAGCLFSSDKKKCKQEVHAKCDSKSEGEGHEHDGSGSGSGGGFHHHEPTVGETEKNETHHKHHRKHHKHHKHHQAEAPVPTQA